MIILITATIIDWLSSNIFSVLSGGGIVGVISAVLHYSHNKKMKGLEEELEETKVKNAQIESKGNEAKIWMEQLEAERRHVAFKDERIDQLLRMNAEKEDRYQREIKEIREQYEHDLQVLREQYADQTKFVRGVHKDLEATMKEKMELVEEIGELKIELEKKRCDDHACPFRIPPNAYTPSPINQTKEEYAQERPKIALLKS